MVNDTQNLRVIINEAAIELSKIFPNIDFDNAQWIIRNFIQYYSLSDGFPKIVIDDDTVQIVHPRNIIKSLTFHEATEIASETFGLVTGPLIISILGGLLLLKSLYKLAKVTIEPVDSLMIIALLGSRRKGGYTDEEWIESIKQEEYYGIRISQSFGMNELNKRGNELKKLKVIELVDGLWKFSDEIVYK